MGDIDETQLQEDLEFSGYFIAVRVWTEGNYSMILFQLDEIHRI
jgi:hypothetical protein